MARAHNAASLKEFLAQGTTLKTAHPAAKSVAALPSSWAPGRRRQRKISCARLRVNARIPAPSRRASRPLECRTESVPIPALPNAMVQAERKRNVAPVKVISIPAALSSCPQGGWRCATTAGRGLPPERFPDRPAEASQVLNRRTMRQAYYFDRAHGIPLPGQCRRKPLNRCEETGPVSPGSSASACRHEHKHAQRRPPDDPPPTGRVHRIHARLRAATLPSRLQQFGRDSNRGHSSCFGKRPGSRIPD